MLDHVGGEATTLLHEERGIGANFGHDTRDCFTTVLHLSTHTHNFNEIRLCHGLS